MAKRKDKQAAETAPVAASAIELTTTRVEPLLIEGPKAPVIDLAPSSTATADESADAKPSETIEPAEASRWTLPAYAPLAATVAFAIALGAIAGAAASSGLLWDQPQPAAAIAAADATRALQDKVAQLNNEVAALKAGIATSQRSSSAQLGKITERLDRTEKAQAEPAAKLAKLQESVDRLEHRPVAAAAAAPEVTGSVTAPKEESKPQIAEGWRLRDFYDGRAVVESRNGTLFRVAPGSNVPGLGRVETIKRENGKVVVVTASGIIAGSFEQRRPSYYLPFRW